MMTDTTQVEVRRKISAYDIVSADHPDAIISHPFLKGIINYEEWAIGMKTALTSRNRFGFLDGTIPKPHEGSRDMEDWLTIQALLVSWIKMTIDPVLRSTISHRDVAKDLWDHLKKRFSVMNGVRIQQLKAELAGCKQHGQSVEAYYRKFSRIWDNLATHQPLLTCKCGNCMCNLGTAQELDREEDRVHQFLFGLDEKFRFVRSSLVARVPIQSLEEVYNNVRQEEEWWGVRSKGRSVQGRGRNSAASYAGKGRGQSSYVNQVSVSESDKHQERGNHVITDKDRDGVSGLSKQQWNAIKCIMNGGASSANKTGTETMTGPYFEDADWSG